MTEQTVLERDPDLAGLRKAALAVYLAAEAGPAEDISRRLQWAANEIERLRSHIKRAEHQISAGLKVHGLELLVDLENNYSVGERSQENER